ncbi:MAG: hypothetical protein M3P96_12680, partial [Actinomycetota bacterium]|nr:hypothetical protein [Actinomycetota bacterium]
MAHKTSLGVPLRPAVWYVLAMPDPSCAPLREELAREVQRVADRLRSLALTRLGQPAGGHPSRAAAARAAA